MPHRHRPAAGLIIAAGLLLQGCQPVVHSPSNPNPSAAVGAHGTAAHGTAAPATDTPEAGTTAEWPLRFTAHNFGAFSYSTYGCKVVYGDMLRLDDPDAELQISSESLGGKYPENLDAGFLGIANFPPPARVTWRSRDGTPLSAEVDVGEIFADGLIRHNVAREEIPAGTYIGPPAIILVVDDRTVSVYMRARIPTKALQRPGNRYSDFRAELIEVYSRTY